MGSFQQVMTANASTLVIPFPRRPESIFEGVEMPTAVWLRSRSTVPQISTSTVRRFYSEEREIALASTRFVSRPPVGVSTKVPKLDGLTGLSILRLLSSPQTVELVASKTGAHRVFYQEACRYWAKSSCFQPRFIRNGEHVDQPHGRTITFSEEAAASFVNCLLNSSLFYWYYSTLADCEHVNDSLVRGFPLPSQWRTKDWAQLSRDIDEELRSSATPKTIRTKQGHVIEYDELDGRAARSVVVQADIALGELFGLSNEQLDYWKRLAKTDTMDLVFLLKHGEHNVWHTKASIHARVPR
jgi:hypothetical protein